MRSAVKRLLVPLPGAVAAWVAASRVHDDWHSATDVVAGLALGAACGCLVFVLMDPRASGEFVPINESITGEFVTPGKATVSATSATATSSIELVENKEQEVPTASMTSKLVPGA